MIQFNFHLSCSAVPETDWLQQTAEKIRTVQILVDQGRMKEETRLREEK